MVEGLQAGLRDTLLEVQRRTELSTERQIAELQAGFNQTIAARERSEPQDDKFQAISSLEIKRHLPTIADTDPDIKKHNEAFDMHIACQNSGGKKMRAIDILFQYGLTFKEGSIRKRVFDDENRKGKNEG